MNTILIILALHWVADFVLQTDAMAKGKSSSNYWLGYHVLMYMVPFAIVFGGWFAVVNGVAHFCVDYITSRITSRLWKEGKVHYFFVVIGADQLLHVATLLYTAHRILHSF